MLPAVKPESEKRELMLCVVGLRLRQAFEKAQNTRVQFNIRRLHVTKKCAKDHPDQEVSHQ